MSLTHCHIPNGTVSIINCKQVKGEVQGAQTCQRSDEGVTGTLFLRYRNFQ